MEIEKLREEKENLELDINGDIANRLLEFSTKTGVVVTKVEIEMVTKFSIEHPPKPIVKRTIVTLRL